ncbi:MAG: VCBS repeat-containing protein [Bacteroidota bacterium]
MKMKFSYYIVAIFIVVSFSQTSCIDKTEKKMFTQLAADKSGIDFSNDIRENDSSHSFINEFGYMGGGVGIGDFNNDGLKDIFFTGNQVSCRLYINKGNNHFEDITKAAGLTTNEWATGVSIADVNHDGYDDIYVSVFGKDLLQRAKNLLFINQHDLTFRESATEYGLADTGYSTQAVFLDYDRDGDLDMYLTNYRLNGPNANYLVPRDNSSRSPANDRLYRNNGYDASVGHDVFSDVSMQAGIKEDGYGLGVVAGDFNEDGWPDIYVANDFVSNDELWLNNQKGGFSNAISKAIRHQSYSSMGADAADINNDGLEDIVTLDMAPEYNERKKQTFFFMNYERYQSERWLGYEPEFSRNMLQLNNGTRDSIPLFSEIGQLAGISETDWSWSVLLADFNNDGWKDIHITNGIGRDFINGDFLEFSNNTFANAGSQVEQRKTIRNKLATLMPVSMGNYLYLNKRDHTFSDISAMAGVDDPSLSNGAAYVDLDNDGDLDIVTNNINQPAFVLINNTSQPGSLTNHFIKLQLRGDSLNTRGFGAKIKLYSNGMLQVQEQNPVRGYFSSVDPDLLFGLEKQTKADSIIITWPDQKIQVLKEIPADTAIVISWKLAVVPSLYKNETAAPLLSDITASAHIAYAHHENVFNDFGIQRLLPQKYSQMGPFIAAADIDGDGTTDFFAGNGINFSGQFISQHKDGSFSARKLTDSIKMEEDMDCVFFDADGDGDEDLLVTGGDVQYQGNSPYYRPRLYINDSKGNFHLSSSSIPGNVTTIAGCVRVADYDNDGDPDLFIGGRVSKTYPVSPKSYILQNNKGVFTDVTARVCPALQNAGMVSTAVWMDFDNDKQTDLVIAGEWMPVRFFKNNNGQLNEITATTGLADMNGMWRSLIATDIDNDGDMDLVAGNLGLNCIYKAGPSAPMQLFASDIDGNGIIDPVLFYYIKDKDGVRRSYPAIGRSQFAEQVPAIKKKFLRYQDYAKATFDDIFKGKPLDNMLSFTCNETRSCWLENKGNGKFLKHPLPIEAQFAPVNAMVAEDLDGDGYKDLLIAGNEYQTDVMIGRYDASYGTVLKGSKNGIFTTVPSLKSGFIVEGDIKSMVLIPAANGGKLLVAAANNDSLRVFKINKPAK